MQITADKPSRSTSVHIYYTIRIWEVATQQRQQISRIISLKIRLGWWGWLFLHCWLWFFIQNADAIRANSISRPIIAWNYQILMPFLTIHCWWCIFFCTLCVKCLNSWLLPAIAPLPERWPSGRRRSPAKGVYPEGYRGFESHPLRQNW